MKKEFNTRFNELEAKRKKLFEELKSCSDEFINKKPDANTWSISEVILHLMAADEASLNYLQKKTLGISSTKKTGLKNSYRFLILKIAFVLPLKFKAPTITTPTAKYATLKELNEKWNNIKNDTITLINKLNDEDFKKELWLHPVTGKMNLMQMINFITIHFDRHKQQIDKITNSKS